MRQSKFTETQIVSMLKEADAGRPINDMAERQHQFHDLLRHYMTFISTQAWVSLLESSRG